MPKNPPDGMPRLTPYLFYNDLAAALDWLAKTFGFEEGDKLPGPDGKLVHAEMRFKESVVMMGSPCEDEDSRSPCDAGGITQSLYIYVDDVEEHYKRAIAAGADKVTAPEEMFWGDRMYTVRDPEGHRWAFAQHIRDIAFDDMKPPVD